MKNFRNIFREYQDPKVLKDLRFASLALIVTGILLAFVVSPSLRHEIGIGQNTPVEREAPKVGKAHPLPHIHFSTTPHKRGTKAHMGNNASLMKHNEQSGAGVEGGSGGNGGRSTPTVPGSPPSPQPTSPTPSNPNPTAPSSPATPPNGGGGNGGGEGGESSGNTGGKITVEVPALEVPPLVEEVTNGVNETVNGVTGAVNEVTKEAPIHVEIPKVCLVKC